MINKKCPHCNECKSSDQFYKRTNGNLFSWCKKCSNACTKKRRENESVRSRERELGRWRYSLAPEEHRKKSRDWRFKNPELVAKTKRKFNLMSNFGITEERYEQILASQGNKCAICINSENLDNKNLAVDHFHVENYNNLAPEQKSKFIRGLLCQRHNLLLGQANDDVEDLRRCINYLQQFNPADED